MCLRAQIANQDLKQNAQTQDADGVQTFFCVMCDTVRGYISTVCGNLAVRNFAMGNFAAGIFAVRKFRLKEISP